jgi:peptidoglycan hydrolase CwlO-like protein
MRTILSAAIVIAIVFMIGCGASAEEKNTIKTQSEKIATLEKTIAKLQTNVDNMGPKADEVDKYMKSHFKDYGDTTKKATTPVKPAAPAAPKKTTGAGKTK